MAHQNQILQPFYLSGQKDNDQSDVHPKGNRNPFTEKPQTLGGKAGKPMPAT